MKRPKITTTATLAEISHPITLVVQLRDSDGCHPDPWRITLDDADGKGFVALSSPDFAATYWWPLWARGTSERRRSLLGFLLGTGVDYVAGKMDGDDAFDADRTLRLAKVELWRRHRKDYADHKFTLEGVRTRSDFEHWVNYEAPGEHVWDTFGSCLCTRIRPDFQRFYSAAWPMLREKRAEIEAVLYPNGLPMLAREVA